MLTSEVHSGQNKRPWLFYFEWPCFIFKSLFKGVKTKFLVCFPSVEILAWKISLLLSIFSSNKFRKSGSAFVKVYLNNNELKNEKITNEPFLPVASRP